jgi:ribosomal protein S12 methylthiotransferase
LQHWSNLTLLSMNRPPQAHTKALLQKLVDRIPGLALRTTFISGFPGTREQLWQLALLRHVPAPLA